MKKYSHLKKVYADPLESRKTYSIQKCSAADHDLGMTLLSLLCYNVLANPLVLNFLEEFKGHLSPYVP